jgi:hypothetical protein
MARIVAICLAVTAAVACAAFAKEGMTATLLGHPRLNAGPGTQITVAWKLSSTSADAARGDDHRFYVRLLSKTGASSTHAYGKLRGRRYIAHVGVPGGGVADIEIRLVGWRITPGATRRADVLIPITNDPFP